MTTRGQVDRAIGELGELVYAHEGDADLSRFEPYADDPVGFCRDVLGDDPGPWRHQVEALEAVRDFDRVAWRSGQGCGKGWTIARACLWHAYAVRGQVLLSGPTARTVHEVLMRKEIARAHRRGGLPGELYTNALRIEGDEAAILAYTATSASGGTGHHASAVLAILDEAQGVPPEAWEAMYANVTGEADKLFVCGNPLRPTGEFFEVSRPDSGWWTLQTSCREHPNLVEGQTRYIPGGPSVEWLDRMRDRWGESSPMWTARVGGEFPLDQVTGLYSFSDVEAAVERGSDPDILQEAADGELVVAVDVARHGLDSTVAAIRRGPVVEALHSWSGASTTETVEKVRKLAYEAGVRAYQLDGLPADLRASLREKGEGVGRGEIRVDTVGVGAGVKDQLAEDGWPAVGFKASRSAKDSSRFADARAEAFWQLRELLEEGVVGLPEDPELREEMLSVDWSPDAKGRVRIESKDSLKSKLGRSPDRMDAVVIAVALRVTGRRPRQRIVHWSPG